MTSFSNTDNIYFDLTVFNADVAGSGQPKILNYTEIKPAPFISNPSNYYLSVQRFHLDTGNLPVFIPQIQINQPDPDLTIYEIHMTYEFAGQDALEATTPIKFYSLNGTAKPAPPTNRQEYKNKYYWVYSYQSFIDTVNFHLRSAFNDLSRYVQTQGTREGITEPYGNNPPYMVFDPATYIITIFADKAYFKDNVNDLQPGEVRMNLYFNAALYKLFKSFPARFNGYNNFGKDYQIIFYNTNNGSNTSTLQQDSGGTYDALFMTQEYSSVPLWNPIESIVFTSDFLHVEPTNVGSISDNAANTITLSSDGNNANFANIITSFQVQISPTNGYNPTIDYVAVNPNQRLIDLKGTQPMNTLDIKAWWRTNFNELIPIELDSNCMASMLLCFKRKDTSYYY